MVTRGLMRVPVSVRIIAGIIGALAWIWVVLLVIQGRLGTALMLGILGTVSESLAFAPMRDSAY